MAYQAFSVLTGPIPIAIGFFFRSAAVNPRLLQRLPEGSRWSVMHWIKVDFQRRMCHGVLGRKRDSMTGHHEDVNGFPVSGDRWYLQGKRPFP